MELSPALREARFCPRCGREAEVDYPRSLTCAHCGFVLHASPEPVACAIPHAPDGRMWLLRRALHAGRGLWTFPGGFVELGETVEEAARRETREEMGIGVELGALVGVYSRREERIVLVVFAAEALATPRPTEEASEVRAFAPEELPWDELAFWSTQAALTDLLGRPQGDSRSRVHPPPAARP